MCKLLRISAKFGFLRNRSLAIKPRQHQSEKRYPNQESDPKPHLRLRPSPVSSPTFYHLVC